VEVGTVTNRPFADAVAAYAQAGWPCVLPVPTAAKYPPPVGFTGADGCDTDPMQLVQWAGSHGDHSIALRMPDGVIGLDVDHYDKVSKNGETVHKRGADSLAEYERQWGELPPTWISSARELPSGIRFYRVPPGRYRTTLGDAIEIIQRHHRYAVVAPSPHTETGGEYGWFLNGTRFDLPDWHLPSPNSLPELPQAWVEGLREGATEAGPAAADHASGSALLGQLLADERPACAETYDALSSGLSRLQAAHSGGRHDAAIAAVHRLVQLGASGHPGAGQALAELSAAWFHITAGEDREGEWDNMLLTSARKAVTAHGARQVDRDPCLLGEGLVVAPAAADARVIDSNANDSSSIKLSEPDRQALFAAAIAWSRARPGHVREVVGAAPFEPQGEHDQTLAKDVLERTRPVLNYAFDSGGWLLWGPERWGTRPDLAEWAITELARLMPRGDAKAEKGTEEHRVAARRARFMAAGASGSIAKKMRALVAAGTHESSVELARLDAEPDVLWAGGVPWDLRSSTTCPAPSGIDPNTPHMHSAAVAPDPAAETPLWDTFLSAVWPDAELRAWALRVLAIALTGYADRALPILLGETGRGKTQVVSLLMATLGTYAHAADPRLLGGVDKTHASIVYALKGRRLSFIDEAPRDSHAGQERLKQLTGGGELTANEMNRNPITFRPTHTLILTANDAPMLTDPAVRSRARLIPCEGDPDAVRAARAAIGHVQGHAWLREAPGVLAAMMREAALWLAEPDTALTAAAPVGIRYLAENLAADQDPIAAWIEEETEAHPEGERSRTLYEAFVAWCRNGNMAPGRIPTETKWGREISQRGYPAKNRRDGGYVGKYRPLRLRRGGWSPLLPTGPVAGSQTNVAGGSGSQTQPATPENARSNPVSVTSVTGVAGSTHSLTHTRAYAHTQEAVEGPKLATPATPATAAAPPAKTPVAGAVTGPATAPAKPLQPSELTQRLLAARETPATSAKTAKAALAVAEREKARRGAIEAAAGPRVALPAAVDRAGTLVPLTIDQATAAVRQAIERAAGELTVDVETSGYPVGHADYALRTIQLGDKQISVVFDAADAVQSEATRQPLADAPILHAHSATADLVPLDHAGLIDPESAWDRMDDTVIRAKLADPRSTGSDASGLKELARDVLGSQATAPAAEADRKALFAAGKWLTETKVDTPISRSGWAQVDSTCSTMVRYAASDVLDTAALPEVLPAPEPALHARERTVQRMVARVSHRGLQIDGDHVQHLRTEHTAGKESAAEQVRTLGVANPGSDKELVARLTTMEVPLPRTPPSKTHPQGQPSVAAGVLDRYKEDGGELGELVRAVLDYRHHETALGLFLEPYHQLTTRGDGRARPTVYTLGADTGRMSCVRPNFQQLPREGGIRACITADPGQLLIAADFSSVEIRVAAALSGDQNLQRMIAEGRDLHWEIARQVWGPNATKGHRYSAKRIVFGRFYGGAVETLAKQAGVSEERAAAAIAVLDALAPQLTAWSMEIRRAIKDGRTHFPSYAGRVIHLPANKPHAGPNYAIQGTARELLMDGLIKWNGTRWATATLWPVHDEVDVAVPADEAEEATAALVACMETELFGVPIVAEPAAPSFAWADSV
jgi:P4 family phage/plasmid primase-like protien